MNVYQEIASQRLTEIAHRFLGENSEWFEPFIRAANAPNRGTLKAWFAGKHDTQVDTLQFSVWLRGADLGNHVPGSLWTPAYRTVSTDRASYVTLSGSRRDYAGITHIYSDDTIFVGYDSTSADGQISLVAYKISSDLA